MFLDDDYLKRYKVLEAIRLDLDEDPVANGLQSLTTKLSQVQGLRNRINSAIGEALRNKADTEIALKSLEHEKEVALARLMSGDSEVSGQRSDKLREAAAQTKVAELLLRIHHAGVSHIKAKTYMDYLERLHSTLEAANYNLSRQISVVQMSVDIKEVDSNYYGTISGPSKTAQ